jgi:hypothetical protein
MIKENISEFEKANVIKYQQMPIKKDVGAIVILDSGHRPRPHDNIEIVIDNFTSDKSGHNTQVCGVTRQVAPDARIISFNWFGGDEAQIVDWIIEHENEIAVINCSYTSIQEEDFNRLEQTNIPILSSSGNTGGSIRYPANLDWVMAVGAFEEHNNNVADYSSVGSILEIVAFTNIYLMVDPETNKVHWFNGTSCASPFASAQLWLYMSRAGIKFNREQARAFMWRNTLDLYEKGHDERSGYGLFRLPDEIERSTPMFNDIETRSEEAKEAIEWAAREGLVKGNTDGTYAPTEPVTREQLAIILHRMSQK